MENLSQSQIHDYNEAILTRIRELCVSRKTSITKIEQALGYGNGTVSGWTKAKRKAPHDRVVAIARHLGVSSDYLETGTETKKSPTTEGEGITKEQIKIALFGDDAGDISDEDLDNAVQFARFAARERKQRGDNK